MDHKTHSPTDTNQTKNKNASMVRLAAQQAPERRESSWPNMRRVEIQVGSIVDDILHFLLNHAWVASLVFILRNIPPAQRRH